jgi:hypothetical protein
VGLKSDGKTGALLAHNWSMEVTTVNSTDPKVHAENIGQMLRAIIDHARQDIDKVNEPRFQSLLETTAEVLQGLETAFRHYTEGKEKAWRS